MFRLTLSAIGATLVTLAGMLLAYVLESWLPLGRAPISIVDEVMVSSALLVHTATGGMDPASALFTAIAFAGMGIYGLVGGILGAHLIT